MHKCILNVYLYILLFNILILRRFISAQYLHWTLEALKYIIAFLIIKMLICVARCAMPYYNLYITLTRLFLSVSWLDLLFLLSPPAAAATCFCSHSRTPARIIFKYLQYAYWPWRICLVYLFLRFLVSSTKSKIAAEKHMSLSRAGTAL